MRRKWALISVGVLVLCGVGMLPVLAQGPDQNPIYATIEYVDQRISELTDYVDQNLGDLHQSVDQQFDEVWAAIDELGGGGTGPDFDLPADQDWLVDAYTYSNAQGCSAPYLRVATDAYGDNPAATCNWQGVSLLPHHPISIPNYPTGQAAAARAAARYGGEVVGYGTGGCGDILFRELEYLPAPGEAIEVDIWVFWMGAEKTTTISPSVVQPPNTRPEWLDFTVTPDSGQAPLTVRYRFEVHDPDPCEVLSFVVDLGDGTSLDYLPESHTYDTPGYYQGSATVTDHAGLSDYGVFEIWVD